MSIHDVCTLYAAGCLRNISSVSPWYPLVGIPIGVHSPHSARLGYPLRLKINMLTRPLPAFYCSEYMLAMDMLAESRLTFGQDQTVQPFAMLIERPKKCCSGASTLLLFVVNTLVRRALRQRTRYPLEGNVRTGQGQSPLTESVACQKNCHVFERTWWCLASRRCG